MARMGPPGLRSLPEATMTGQSPNLKIELLDCQTKLADLQESHRTLRARVVALEVLTASLRPKLPDGARPVAKPAAAR